MDGRKPIEQHLSDPSEGGDIASRAFGRAYMSLRMQILSGAVKPGQHLDINALTKSIGVSSSPLREALCTLATEGLLESGKGSGFHVPAFDFTAITDLLRWSDHLSAQSLKGGAYQPGERKQFDADNHVIRVILLFQEIGQMAGNREIARALGNATLRLHGLYRVESTVLSDTADELAHLENALENTPPDLRRPLRAFHQRRIAILPKIARVVQIQI